MWTVSKLAESCGLSRSTVLYYESIGLLKPAGRSCAQYRRYGETELRRLRQIRTYRDSGLKLADIRALLDHPESDAASILERRLAEINREIETLRRHQQSILKLMRNSASFRRTRFMNKEKWVSIMRSSGLTEDDMHRWHIEFEKAAPEDHQQFLEFLHIAPAEIESIRDWSRKGAAA